MSTPKYYFNLTLKTTDAKHAVAALLSAAADHQHNAERYQHTDIDVAKGLARIAKSCLEVATLIGAYGDCAPEHCRTLDVYRQRNENLRMNLSLFGKPQGA